MGLYRDVLRRKQTKGSQYLHAPKCRSLFLRKVLFVLFFGGFHVGVGRVYGIGFRVQGQGFG